MSKCNNLVKDVTENMDKFELGIALSKIYDFIWDEFCDWYIEIAKYRIYHADEDPESANDALWTLREVLKKGLKLLHPYMPFVSEEIYSKLVPEEESLMMSDWPQYDESWNYPIAENIAEHYKEIIRGIRNVRAEMNVPKNRKATAYVVCEDAQLCTGLEMLRQAAQNMAAVNDLIIQHDTVGIPEDAVSIVVPDATVYLPLEELIDFEQEIERLEKEETRLTKEIARATGMLNNEKFVSKAPEAKVQEEREKLETYEQMMAQVKERLEGLKAKRETKNYISLDLKGGLKKIKNLKREDVKAWWKNRKERRARILEERKNSEFAKKMKPVYAFMNRFSLVFHALLACVINFAIEAISRHSVIAAGEYMIGTPLVFLYNAFMIFIIIFGGILFQTKDFRADHHQRDLADPGSGKRLYAFKTCHSV